MTSDPRPVPDDDLHALVDGQLEPERVEPVLAWLQAHPEDAARVAAWQAQRLALRRAARLIEREEALAEVPAVLSDGVLRHAARQRRQRTAWQGAAAALLLCGGLGAGMLAERWRQGLDDAAPAALARSPAFVREAVAAHAVFVPEKRHPVEVAASDEAHLVQWLSRRLGAPLTVPALGDQGFRLLGGRLLPGDAASPRAQFMYENASGTRLTLYVSVFGAGQAPAETAFRSVRDGARESFYWVDGDRGYALSGELPPGELQALARSVYRQLDR